MQTDWTLTIVRTDLGRAVIDAMVADGVIETRPGDDDPGAIALLHKLAAKSRSRWPEWAAEDARLGLPCQEVAGVGERRLLQTGLVADAGGHQTLDLGVEVVAGAKVGLDVAERGVRGSLAILGVVALASARRSSHDGVVAAAAHRQQRRCVPTVRAPRWTRRRRWTHISRKSRCTAGTAWGSTSSPNAATSVGSIGPGSASKPAPLSPSSLQAADERGERDHEPDGAKRSAPRRPPSGLPTRSREAVIHERLDVGGQRRDPVLEIVDRGRR